MFRLMFQEILSNIYTYLQENKRHSLSFFNSARTSNVHTEYGMRSRYIFIYYRIRLDYSVPKSVCTRINLYCYRNSVSTFRILNLRTEEKQNQYISFKFMSFCFFCCCFFQSCIIHSHLYSLRIYMYIQTKRTLNISLDRPHKQAIFYTFHHIVFISVPVKHFFRMAKNFETNPLLRNDPQNLPKLTPTRAYSQLLKKIQPFSISKP